MLRDPTFNHLPKNHLIWRVSLRLAKFAFKFIGLEVQCVSSGIDILRAEGKVSDLSASQTPHGARTYSTMLTRVPAGASSKSSRMSRLRMRMHPIDPGFPISTASGLPWM